MNTNEFPIREDSCYSWQKFNLSPFLILGVRLRALRVSAFLNLRSWGKYAPDLGQRFLFNDSLWACLARADNAATGNNPNHHRESSPRQLERLGEKRQKRSRLGKHSPRARHCDDRPNPGR